MRVGDRKQNRKVRLHSRNMPAVEMPQHRVCRKKGILEYPGNGEY